MTGGSMGRSRGCAAPIGDAILADYWAGVLAAPDEETVELHLFDCDSCGARLHDAIALAEGVRGLVREGRLALVVSDAFLRRLAQDGLQVREYAAAPGGSVNCTVGADDVVVAGRLAADLRAVRGVDLSICDERGTEQFRRSDIPVSPDADSVIFHEAVTFLKSAPTFTMVVKLVAVDADSERPIGEYTFNHTRTLPGPGAW